MNDAQKDIRELPLHDAIVQEILISWPEKRVILKLEAFLDPSRNAVPCQLVFGGVTNAVVPHQAPWGESSCINEARSDGALYKIEMQTGDILQIEASVYAFEHFAL
jgi:hypothetical protein